MQCENDSPSRTSWDQYYPPNTSMKDRKVIDDFWSEFRVLNSVLGNDCSFVVYQRTTIALAKWHVNVSTSRNIVIECLRQRFRLDGHNEFDVWLNQMKHMPITTISRDWHLEANSKKYRILIHLPKHPVRMWDVCMDVIGNASIARTKPKPNRSELKEAERMIGKARQIAKQTSRRQPLFRKQQPSQTSTLASQSPSEAQRVCMNTVKKNDAVLREISRASNKDSDSYPGRRRLMEKVEPDASNYAEQWGYLPGTAGEEKNIIDKLRSERPPSVNSKVQDAI